MFGESTGTTVEVELNLFIDAAGNVSGEGPIVGGRCEVGTGSLRKISLIRHHRLPVARTKGSRGALSNF
jgi:hypothetical protein